MCRYVSHEKATRELGYHPRPLQETIEDILRWNAENGNGATKKKRAIVVTIIVSKEKA